MVCLFFRWSIGGPKEKEGRKEREGGRKRSFGGVDDVFTMDEMATLFDEGKKFLDVGVPVIEDLIWVFGFGEEDESLWSVNLCVKLFL